MGRKKIEGVKMDKSYISPDYINQVLDSIEGCLSISVGSCDKCVCKNVPSPRCKNKLLIESAKIINYLKEKANED